jgi:hypothetical protein
MIYYTDDGVFRNIRTFHFTPTISFIENPEGSGKIKQKRWLRLSIIKQKMINGIWVTMEFLDK